MRAKLFLLWCLLALVSGQAASQLTSQHPKAVVAQIDDGDALVDALYLPEVAERLLRLHRNADIPRLSAQQGFDRRSIGGRQGLHTVASNVSDVTGGQEVIDVYTTMFPDGSLFYVLGVAPREDYSASSNAFRNVVRSIQFAR